MKTRKLKSGLTLVEMTVVVAIVSILLVIVGGSLVSFIRPSSSSIADKIKAGLIQSFRTAQISNCTVIFEVDMENNSYRAFKVLRDDTGVKEKKIIQGKLPSNNRIVDITDIRGIKFENIKLRIPFTHNGVSEDYNIHIGSDSTSINKTILLHRYNGRVFIKNGEVNRKITVNQNKETSEIKDDKED
jgi:prepilin-type N-terminal cleavage/methylation domain-containing protein